MRQFVIILLYLLCQSVSAVDTHLKDSLSQLLTNSATPQRKMEILRNLADIYNEFPQEEDYLKQLITESEKAGNNEIKLDALGDLTNCFISKKEPDSARHYLNKIKRMNNTTNAACWQTFLKICLFELDMKQGSESGIEAINKELEKPKANTKSNKTIYDKIEDAYVIACGYEVQEKHKEALPFCVSALNLAETLPLKERMRICTQIIRMLKLLYINNQQFEKVTPLLEKHIYLQEKHYKEYLQDKRPFYPIESFRISNYTTLIINIRHLPPEKVSFYLKNIIELSKKTKRPKDKYNCFLAINNYYLFKKNYPMALSMNDSLIEYAKTLMPYYVPGLYDVSSQIHEAMKQPAEALKTLKMSYALKDSLTAIQSLEQLNELQVQYNLNKLNFENSQLEIKNKRIMLISLSFVLIIFIFISAYLYMNLKKEKAMKERLNSLKMKAEESEKMKITFMNSVCHEIRTPLNAIVGFSDIIFDTSIDNESRQIFSEEIQKNTLLLTGLINSMLEVSNLDVSNEKLPCEPTDISVICHNETDRIKALGKPEINFHLSIPEEPLVFSTNAQYLAVVIDNLLNNANKFTQSGDVTLEYHLDKVTGCLLISVTDTGCGIPEDKHKEVFERFNKLNSFIPGNGLGLYLCRLIINRLSGNIAIDKEYKTGTRIIVSLPTEQQMKHKYNNH